eukprot:s866_g4.t1
MHTGLLPGVHAAQPDCDGKLGQLESYRTNPLLLQCDNLRCDCTFGEQPTFSIHFDPVSVHAGAVEAQILALLPFIRALRAQQNQVEQAWAFFLAMWVCAVFVDPIFAGCCAWIWVPARMAYGYMYRVSPSRNRLMWATVPAYLAQATVCGGILSSVLPLAHLVAVTTSALIVVAFGAYGWLVYRPWFGSFVVEEKKRLQNQLIPS